MRKLFVALFAAAQLVGCSGLKIILPPVVHIHTPVPPVCSYTQRLVWDGKIWFCESFQPVVAPWVWIFVPYYPYTTCCWRRY